jgi:hypothetical protein
MCKVSSYILWYNLKVGVTGHEKWGGGGQHFLGPAHHDVTTRTPIQTYPNNHMIAKLAEPRISVNISRPFPHVHGGVEE